MIIIFFVVMVSSCSVKKDSIEWISSELAGIEDPGFSIISKTENANSISFMLENIDIEKVDQFIDDLSINSEFTLNKNYNYDSNSYSYAAFNNEKESIHFTYNVEDKTGFFIYAKSGNSLFIPGIRDMGYSVTATYDYASNNDYTQYNASLFYSISLNVKFTNSTEQLVSFVLSDFYFKTESALGNLGFYESIYGDSIEVYTIAGSSIYDLSFFIVQKSIGQYPTSTPFGDTSTFFDVMGINQNNLDFTVAFTAEIITTSGTYNYDYEILVMPDGSDATKMDRYMTVDYFITTIEKGIPFNEIN